MICAAEQPDIAAALCDFAGQAKPVVALATDFTAQVPHIYVGPDNVRAGRVAGHLMGRFMGAAGGEVLVIAGMTAMIGHRERREGFRAALTEGFPNVRIAEEVESGEIGEKAGQLVVQALAQHPGLRGIYNASAGATEIAKALSRVAEPNRCLFITHELTEGRRRLLRAGLIDAIIDQDPDMEIRVAVDALAAQFGRLGAGPSNTVTPVQIHICESC